MVSGYRNMEINVDKEIGLHITIVSLKRLIYIRNEKESARGVN